MEVSCWSSCPRVSSKHSELELSMLLQETLQILCVPSEVRMKIGTIQGISKRDAEKLIKEGDTGVIVCPLQTDLSSVGKGSPDMSK